MNTRIPIRDIMSTEPRTISPDASAREAARRMKEAAVGSLLVTENSTLMGIVTESDLMKKVVAEDRRPGDVTVKEIMTADPVTIAPDTDMHDAMKTMARLGIRRLPVVVDGDLVGMVTQNDITRVSPMLLEVIREWENAYGEREPEETREPADEPYLEGICVNCEAARDDLRVVNGELFCAECRDEVFGGEEESEREAGRAEAGAVTATE